VSALFAYLGALVTIHVAWAYFYLCGTLVRPPRLETGPASDAPASGAALVDIVLTTACGMALTGFATFVLGLLHLLYPVAIPLWLALLGLVFARRADPPWRAAFWRSRVAVWHAAVSPGALLLYALALVYGFASARPDLGSDATSYHVVYPLEWAAAHAIFVDPSLRAPFYATNWALLDVWLLMFGLVDATQTLSWLASLLSLLGIYGYVTAGVQRAGHRLDAVHVVLGLLAAAAVAGSTVFLNASVLALVDVPIGLFFLAAALALLDVVRARRWDSVAAFVVCGGFFVGMKPSLIAFFPLLAAGAALAVLLLGGSRRRMALTLVALTVCAAPWYAKNLVQAGDPVTPALNIPLRGVDPHWSADDFHGLALDLKAGEATTPLGRLLVPLQSLTEPSSPAFRADGGTMLILLVWLPAMIAAYALFRRGRVDRLEPFVLAGLVCYGVAYWLTTTYQSRYALVFLPALAALVGALAARIALRGPAFRWAAAALLLACALPTAQNVASARSIAGGYDDLWAHYLDRESWLRDRAPSYPEVEAISAALRRSGRTDLRVYRAYLEFDRLYFAERGIHVAGDLFGPERYLDFQQAIYEDGIGQLVEREHIGAFLLPAQGNVSLAQQARLRDELAALGFHAAPVSDRFIVYLAPGVR
jgi:hypothetical protein